MNLRLTRRWRPYLAAGAIAGVTALSACGGSSSPAGSSSGGQQVVITGTNSLRFSPMTVKVHTGTVRIMLKDMGAYPHNIVIPGLHVTSKTVTGDPGGAMVTFSVTFAHPGHYPFHCQYHASSGMVGTFLVS
jgi:plastocyanin